jgi:class 3 adenylate cyclase
MLPPKAVDELNRGEQVMPEEFESVTILFSDIVGFTEITAKVDPLLVVRLLNQLYSVMDYIATLFPIFKVETIGDSYMIVGGMSGEDDDIMHARSIQVVGGKLKVNWLAGEHYQLRDINKDSLKTNLNIKNRKWSFNISKSNCTYISELSKRTY